MHFSPSTLGWYPAHTKYDNAPDDLIEVPDELYEQLLGKQVEAGPGGMPRQFEAPAPGAVPPLLVKMCQARLALLEAGKLAAVNAAIAAMPSPQKEAAQIEWEFASHVERQSPFLQGLAAAINLDEADLDQLFILAASK